MSDTLLIRDEGPVRVLTLNRPHAANAISLELGHALIAAFDAADADAKVAAVVVTAAGDRHFCAGGDLKERAAADQTPAERDAFAGALLERTRATPSVAAVNGAAFGGGLELALTCDLMICAPNARFAIPEATRGIIASGGGLVRLPAVIGRQRALSMALTGRPIDAQTALTWGLVSELVPGEGLLGRAVEMATSIARNAPLAVAASRRIIAAAGDPGVWELNRRLRHEVGGSADAKEGPRAFAEGREPVWQGR